MTSSLGSMQNGHVFLHRSFGSQCAFCGIKLYDGMDVGMIGHIKANDCLSPAEQERIRGEIRIGLREYPTEENQK